MVEINNSDDLRKWLEGKPKEYSVVIASRIALCVLPFIGKLYSAHNFKKITNISTRATFRANLISWVYCKFPKHGISDAANAASVVAYIAATDIVTKVDVDASQRPRASYASSRTTRTFYHAYASVDATRSAARSADTIQSANAVQSPTSTVARSDIATNVSLLEQGMKTRQLARQPLWQGRMPLKLMNEWQQLKQNLLALNQDWGIWIGWYEDILAGRNWAGLPDDSVKKLSLKIARQENEWWEQDSGLINADMTKWLAEIKPDVPPVPKNKPATVQPVWKDSRLAQSKELVKSNLSEDILAGFAEGLKNELLSLVEDTQEVVNFDKRVLDYFIKTADMLPSGNPDYALLFQLVMRESILYDQLEIIEQQWPDFSAKRYQNLCDQFTTYLDRFAPRRQFDRDVLEGELENVDLDELDKDISQFSNSLRSKEVTQIIDISIPETLDSIDENIKITEYQAHLPVPPTNKTNIINASDKVESVNNIAKALLSSNGFTDEEAGDLIEDGKEAHKQGFKENYVEESYKTGQEDAKIAAKTVNRAKIAENVSNSFVNGLAEKYPKLFGWAKRHKKPKDE